MVRLGNRTYRAWEIQNYRSIFLIFGQFAVQSVRLNYRFRYTLGRRRTPIVPLGLSPPPRLRSLTAAI